VKYNKAQGLIAGRNPGDVISKNSFNDIAPGATGKRFHGEFMKFHKTGQVNTIFDYEFAYNGANVKVRIHLKPQPDGQNCWLFVKRA
jgi:photoactive yellow protein